MCIGTRPEDNDFNINGVQVNDQFGGGNFQGLNLADGLPIPNPDTLAEFKVQTTQYDASYGRNSGGQINIVTKTGGSNAFHGSLWEFFRNEDMNTNDYFRNLAGEPRGLLRENQSGGDDQRPILPNKLYYFGSTKGRNKRTALRPAAQPRNLSIVHRYSHRCHAWSDVRGAIQRIRRNGGGAQWIERGSLSAANTEC